MQLLLMQLLLMQSQKGVFNLKLQCLGSSSKGNCYILEGKSSKLVLEAGISFKHVKEALNFNLDVAGCLITHEHKDHLGHVNSFLINSIQVYGTSGTLEGIQSHNINIIKSKKKFQVGEFIIMPFDSIHDAKEPVNFLIESTETKERLIFLTDTAYCKYIFKDIDYLMIETNYKESTLDENVENGIYPEFLAQRIKETHMEIETALDIIKANDYKKVILIHLSDKNAEPLEFRNKVFKINKNVFIANKGLQINLGG